MMKKTFRMGGIHPEDNKMAGGVAVEEFPLPERAVVYMSQHLGAPAVPVVQKGDKVKAGQLVGEAQAFMSANIHAPVSGTVVAVGPVPDFMGFGKNAVVIDTEGDDWDESVDLSPDIDKTIRMDKEEIIARYRQCGVVGLGGACFPTHIKYMLKPGQKCECLLVNGVECEPYITADHRMMIERAEQCMIGIETALIASGAPKAIVGIEENKPDAIAHMREVAKGYANIEIQPLKMKYPQGAEKQLVKAITGRSVPNGGLPIAVGCIVDNIATTYAMYEAVQKNRPLVATYTTVSGKSLPHPKNLHVRIGTPIREVLAYAGMPDDTGKVVSGGPMMGKAVSNIDAAVAKGMSSFLFMSEKESLRGPVAPCLRCGKCVSVCPMGLRPYLLHRYAERKDWEKCLQEGVLNCIECGCCTYICPANRPILDYLRVAKARAGALARQRKNP